jgi:prevent-host-death family protein
VKCSLLVDDDCISGMKTIPISKFKATCFAVIERVRKSGQPILVTRFGEPMVEVWPAPTRKKAKRWVGSLAATGKIDGDIVSPAGDEDDWEVPR